MPNTLMSADTINDFVISNFIPYAWSNMWETTEWKRIRVGENEVGFTTNYNFTCSNTSKPKSIRISDHGTRRSGSYSFIMTMRPNVYESWKNSTGNWELIGSTNSYQELPREYYSSYCLEIPLICGDYLDPHGRSLNNNTKLKDKYVKHLKNHVWSAVERMHGIAHPVTTKEKMFGVHYSKVKSWSRGEDRKEWAFILS